MKIEAHLHPSGRAVMLELREGRAEARVAVVAEPDTGLIRPEQLVNAVKTLAAELKLKAGV